MRIDVLNRLHVLFPSLASHDPALDTRKQFERARHFAKYIFPRQYGLPNSFISTSPEDSVYNVTDADRELQIRVCPAIGWFMYAHKSHSFILLGTRSMQNTQATA